MPSGYAPCTNWLKKRIRKEWEYEHRDYHLTYVWGLDFDESKRAERIKQTMLEFTHCFPLIDRMLTKEDVHAICEQLHIKRPIMYELGYANNNCIGCVKGGMGYWNKIRKDFPDVFKARAKLEREIGHSILKECYLDELDEARGITNEVLPECSIMCEIIKQTFTDLKTDLRTTKEDLLAELKDSKEILVQKIEDKKE